MCRFWGFLPLLVLVLFPWEGLSLRFDLKSGSSKCIAEDIQINAMAVGHYSVVDLQEGQPTPDSHKITVRVTSPYGNSLHYGDHVDSGQFSFTSTEAGDYMACFWAADHKPPETLTIEFDWRTGVAAKDWPNVAKKGQIDEEMHMLNITTNSRMAWLSFLSLVICLSVAGLQLWHLKTFFERKKLL
ncbi:hypothetical protein AMTRI_Chr04g190690 [Amborella trichopoda]